MHISTRKLAFLGLLSAISVVLIILSGILDFNTVFLLAAASFCVGIAFREGGYRIAAGFYLANILLGLLLAPNKLYCITYAAMGFYLLASEYAYDCMRKGKDSRSRKRLLWIVKYIIFNVIYIPAILFLPQLFYEGTINRNLLYLVLLFGELALLVYDMAYTYFQGNIWNKIRFKLKL